MVKGVGMISWWHGVNSLRCVGVYTGVCVVEVS